MSILHGKRAVVFGAGGSLGAAVAREFAREGAEVFVSGRTQANVDALAANITSCGGPAHAAVVDALDEAAVDDYLEDVVGQAGRIDVVYNGVGPRIGEYANGRRAVDLTIDQFMLPANTVLKSNFVTARGAARHMLRQHGGVILFVTGSPARGHTPGATAIGAVFGALENLTENLAIEVGPAGVRIVCLRTLANVDSRTIIETVAAANVPMEQGIARFADSTFLKVPATVNDTARAAVLLVSDSARMWSGTVVNATAGATLD
ncbi:MAG: SDR family oxidoreductase [Chloroflexi bacterium]|nr:SDR family oxidoreductase [Chloroflexota bacterium]